MVMGLVFAVVLARGSVVKAIEAEASIIGIGIMEAGRLADLLEMRRNRRKQGGVEIVRMAEQFDVARHHFNRRHGRAIRHRPHGRLVGPLEGAAGGQPHLPPLPDLHGFAPAGLGAAGGPLNFP
jgi:hypothetical protein